MLDLTDSVGLLVARNDAEGVIHDFQRKYLVLIRQRTSTDSNREGLHLGITELGLYYPMLDGQLPVFEGIAQETIPELRKEAASA